MKDHLITFGIVLAALIVFKLVEPMIFKKLDEELNEE